LEHLALAPTTPPLHRRPRASGVGQALGTTLAAAFEAALGTALSLTITLGALMLLIELLVLVEVAVPLALAEQLSCLSKFSLVRARPSLPNCTLSCASPVESTR
jgi:hypothetical protein